MKQVRRQHHQDRLQAVHSTTAVYPRDRYRDAEPRIHHPAITLHLLHRPARLVGDRCVGGYNRFNCCADKDWGEGDFNSHAVIA